MVQKLGLLAASAGSDPGPGTKIPHTTWRCQKKIKYGQCHTFQLICDAKIMSQST